MMGIPPPRHIPEHSMHLHACWRPQQAQVVGLEVPALGWHIPWPSGWEHDEDCAPVGRLSPVLAREDGIDRLERSLTADGAKRWIRLQVLE